MGLFGLGLIGGAAQGFSEFKTRQREDENLRKQQEREDKLRGEERAWQLMQFEFQTLSQQQQALFAAGLKQEETAEARTYMEGQIKDLQEKYPGMAVSSQGIAMQAIKSPTTIQGAGTSFPNAATDRFAFTYKDKQGNIKLFPTFDPDIVKDKSERSDFFRQALSLISPDEVAYHLDRYERRNDPNFTGQDFISQYMNVIGTYRQELTNALTYKEGDNIFIRAPNYDFGLDRLPPEVAERFATTVFPSLFGIGVDEIRKTFKVPKQVPVTYDQFTNTFQINEKVVKDSRWAIVEDPNSASGYSYNPQIFATAREIAGYSGAKVVNVMAYAGTSANPEKRLNNIVKAKAVFGNSMTKNDRGFYDVAPEFNKQVMPLIQNMSPKDAIDFIRLTVPAEEPEVATSFQIREGKPTPVYSKGMKDVIGVTTTEARLRTESAERAARVMTDMRQLQDQFGVKEGGVGQLRVTIAGIADFLEDGVDLIQGYGKTGDPQNDALRNEHVSELKTFAQKIRNGDQVGAQALFNMLSRHAAYYIAGAVQGGAQGRAISDFDVKNNAEAMQLDRFFAATDGARINLEYLIEEMERTATIYRGYGYPRNAADIQATLIFEKMMGGRPTDLPSFIANIQDRSAVSAPAVATPPPATPGGGVPVTFGNRDVNVPTPSLP
jgi:hypothetical protein